MADVTMREIKDGIEWYTVTLAGGRTEDDCQCARCGSSAGAVRCSYCGGEGIIEQEDWEDQRTTYARCDVCRGEPITYHCVSSPEWCQSHPMAGREHVESTAMNSQAWADCD